MQLQNTKQKFEAQGLKLAAISYDSPAILKDFAERHNIDFPLLADQPYLVLVAKKPIDDKASELIVKTARALQGASTALVAEPEATAQAIQKQFFAKADPAAITSAVKAMNGGVAGEGKLDVQAFKNQLVFSKEVGTVFGKDFDAATSQNDLWTNSFVERARKN